MKKRRFVPHIIESEQNDYLMDQCIKDSSVKEGSIVSGKVILVDDDVVVVDVGLKNEGVIPTSEFTIDEVSSIPKVNDVVDVYIQKIENKYGKLILSRAKALQKNIWQKLKDKYEKKETVDGVICGNVKGGLVVNLSGVMAFLPGSHVDVRPFRDIKLLIGIKQPFLILKMDEKLGNVIVSRRAVLEALNAENREEMLSKIHQGMVLKGKIKNITDYGAFVSLGGDLCGLDGLLHITDISWARINHPSEILSLGQEIEVMVIRIEDKKISLGIKQINDQVWKDLLTKFSTGNIYTGKISNITDNGLFIELVNGIEGWVYLGEISWIKSKQNSKQFDIGQEVEYKIIDIDSQKYRITLSMKQCQKNPWRVFMENTPIGSVIKCAISNITDFGIFVSVGNNIDGLIHISDISWEGINIELLSNYKKGDLVECKVMSVDPEKEKINLSIKHLSEDKGSSLLSKYKNMLITGILSNINENELEIQINNEVYGIIKKSDLLMEVQLDSFFIGQEIKAKVIGINKQENKLMLRQSDKEDDENTEHSSDKNTKSSDNI